MINRKTSLYVKLFLISGLFNISISGLLIALILNRPALLNDISAVGVKFCLSGTVFGLSLSIKLKILLSIFRRTRDPRNYHLNFFGKKVLHSSVVRASEIVLFFLMMPFFLIAGSYFVASIINILND